MERLSLDKKPEHAAQEAAIHCARYANILHLVKDKVVLDIACGEGYGSALLIQAGAKRVVGVDISLDAVSNAKTLFGDSGAEFLVGDAETISQQLGENVFDLIVSIETIEHIKSPELFLKSLVHVAKSDAIFYITCPNDYWYYPKNTDSNPYHIKKYNLDDFSALTKSVLGDNVQWGLGSAVLGFGTIPLDDDHTNAVGKSWMEVKRAETSLVVSYTENDRNTPLDCSYFVGIWNAPVINFSNSVFSVNMDAYNRIYEALKYKTAQVLRISNEQQETALEFLRKENQNLQQELRKSTILLHAAGTENTAMKESIVRMKESIFSLKGQVFSLTQSVENMSVAYFRYLRISALVPRAVKDLALKLFKRGKI